MRLACQTLSRVIACVSLSLAASVSAQTATPPRATAKPAEQAYKNIQVLKGIPSDELIPSMQFISASLGVECGFCHVEHHFDQDDKKPKQIARKMIQMEMAINQGQFDGAQAVTCNTCHRGSRLPLAIPSISEQASTAFPASRDDDKLPADLPAPDQVVSKYVEAIGGSAAIKKIASRVESGTASFFGREMPVEIYEKSPGKSLTVIHLPDGDNATGFDGSQGWLAFPHRPLLSMSGSELEDARVEADLQLPLHLKEMFRDLRAARPETINGHDTYQLVAFVSKQPRARLYFDQRSGLLLRLLLYAGTPLGPNPTRTDFDDYRTVDGVQVPFRRVTARPSGRFTIQLSEVKQNVNIDDAKFTKPQPAEANAQSGSAH